MTGLTQARVTKVLDAIPNQPKRVEAIAIPSSFPLTVEIPLVANSINLLEGALILVWCIDGYTTKFVSHMADPPAVTALGQDLVDPSFRSSSGDQTLSAAGGASVSVGVSGDVNLRAGSKIDQIYLSGNAHLLRGEAGTVEWLSTPVVPTSRQFISVDSAKVRIGVENSLLSSFGIRSALHEIYIDVLGNIILRNTQGCTVSLTSAGAVSVTAPVSVTVVAPQVSLGGPAGQKLATESFVNLVYSLHTHKVLGAATDIPLPIPNPLATTIVTQAL